MCRLRRPKCITKLCRVAHCNSTCKVTWNSKKKWCRSSRGGSIKSFKRKKISFSSLPTTCSSSTTQSGTWKTSIRPGLKSSRANANTSTPFRNSSQRASTPYRSLRGGARTSTSPSLFSPWKSGTKSLEKSGTRPIATTSTPLTGSRNTPPTLPFRAN